MLLQGWQDDGDGLGPYYVNDPIFDYEAGSSQAAAAAQAAVDAQYAAEMAAQAQIAADYESGASQAAAAAQAAADAQYAADITAQGRIAADYESGSSQAAAAGEAALKVVRDTPTPIASAPRVAASGALPPGITEGQSYIDAAGKIWKYLMAPAAGGNVQYVKTPIVKTPRAIGGNMPLSSVSPGLIVAGIAAFLFLRGK